MCVMCVNLMSIVICRCRDAVWDYITALMLCLRLAVQSKLKQYSYIIIIYDISK